MNKPLVFNIGTHMYKIVKDTTEWYRVAYSLYGCNGTTVEPRPGTPNAQAWRQVEKRFTTYKEADDYAKWLLRPQDQEND